MGCVLQEKETVETVETVETRGGPAGEPDSGCGLMVPAALQSAVSPADSAAGSCLVPVWDEVPALGPGPRNLLLPVNTDLRVVSRTSEEP